MVPKRIVDVSSLDGNAVAPAKVVLVSRVFEPRGPSTRCQRSLLFSRHIT